MSALETGMQCSDRYGGADTELLNVCKVALQSLSVTLHVLQTVPKWRNCTISNLLLTLRLIVCFRFARQTTKTKLLAHTHTPVNPFNGPFSGTTRLSRYQKGKTSLDFTEARDSEWQWHDFNRQN